jgi:hypothetical protein
MKKNTTLREFVKKTITEISGGLRRVRDGGRPQYKIGKVEDDNVELSFSEAEQMFPGATMAWAEIVPELYPDFPFDAPIAIKKGSSWFRIGDKLRVAFKDMPQIELAEWDPSREDWIELNS